MVTQDVSFQAIQATVQIRGQGSGALAAVLEPIDQIVGASDPRDPAVPAQGTHVAFRAAGVQADGAPRRQPISMK